MRTFYGGQIQESLRGDQSVVIMKGNDPNRYDIFIEDISSDEFDHLTGVRAAQYSTVRVYMGISHGAGELIIKNSTDRDPKTLNLRDLDKLVVQSFFLDRNNPEEPAQIVLNRTPEGRYEVAK